MAKYPLPHLSKLTREIEDKKCSLKSNTPWTVQNIIYEICENHLISNDPKKLGFQFEQTYSPDETKSAVSLQISYDWKAKAPQKRPAIFVAREDAKINSSLAIGQMLGGGNIAESRENRITRIDMIVKVIIIAPGVGFAEEFANYMAYPFMYFAPEISKEYCFHKFRLVEISKPALFSADTRDTFIVELIIDTEFNQLWTAKGDHLKLKTVSTEVYLTDDQKPFENQ